MERKVSSRPPRGGRLGRGGVTRMLPVGILLGALAALAIAIAPAHANGNPVTITLTYLDGISNWGPTNAAGVAEMVGKEGELRLVASGLPLLRGERYEVWILNTTRGDRMALGRFSAGEDGIGKLDLVLDDVIPDKEWNLMMLTVESEAGQAAAPSARHSIAGRFPTAASAGRPGELPRTGGAVQGDAAGHGAVLLLAGTLALIVGAFALGRWTTTRRSS